MVTKPFERWKEEELQRTFGIEKLETSPILEDWLAADIQAEGIDAIFLQKFHQALNKRINFWNEDELKFMFISPFIQLIDFNGNKYSTFTQRLLSATLTDIKGNNVLMKGKPELMVATGLQDPYQPFFFLHEYKPEKKNSDADPLGQLLAAMLTTHHLNEQKFPLYGCYVNGRNWFFVVLDGLQYVVSNAYVSTLPNHLAQIYAILKKAKTLIETQLKALEK
jgi:hypothetical protein